MSHNSIQTRDIIVGALIGALLAGSSSRLLSSRSGKKMRRDLTNRYQRARHNIQDFLENLNDSTMGERAGDFKEKAKNALEYVKDELGSLTDENHGNVRTGLIMGALLGAIVTAGAITLIKNRGQDSGLIQKASTQLADWKKIIAGVLENVEHNGSRGLREPSHFINDALELASKGVNLWQRIKTR